MLFTEKCRAVRPALQGTLGPSFLYKFENTASKNRGLRVSRIIPNAIHTSHTNNDPNDSHDSSEDPVVFVDMKNIESLPKSELASFIIHASHVSRFGVKKFHTSEYFALQLRKKKKSHCNSEFRLIFFST